jgi:hypothetical protein
VRKRQRLFALAAILAIAWGALWPLVSTAQLKSPAIPSFICTQSGFQEAPHAPTAPDGSHEGFHCPLCVMTADAALPALAPTMTWMLPARVVRIGPFVAPHSPRPVAQPPPSRAPPVLS